jgi:hypothetical protein
VTTAGPRRRPVLHSVDGDIPSHTLNPSIGFGSVLAENAPRPQRTTSNPPLSAAHMCTQPSVIQQTPFHISPSCFPCRSWTVVDLQRHCCLLTGPRSSCIWRPGVRGSHSYVQSALSASLDRSTAQIYNMGKSHQF